MYTIYYIDFLSFLNENDYLLNNEYYLQQYLHAVLKSIRIPNPDEYKWHSFRWGRAYHASLNGILFHKKTRTLEIRNIRYVSVDTVRGGTDISNALKICFFFSNFFIKFFLN